MKTIEGQRLLAMGWLCLGFCGGLWAEAEFTVASYNLEGYLDVPVGSRPAKSEVSLAQVHESLLTMRADVVALQEMGSVGALLKLRQALKQGGLDYPHWEWVAAFDTNIHVAVLSRFPFVTRQPHTNEGFLLYGRRFRVSRGFAEVEVRVHERYRFSLITAHLKSRRESASADQAELREQEAMRLRRIIEARLQARPEANLVVLGDFNDHPDSAPLRLILARGKKNALIDTRPAEWDEGAHSDQNAPTRSRRVTWTYFYAKEDVYSRIDYILLSRGMAREWDPTGTYVLRMPNWGVGSDHRPIVARFQAVDR
jgi:endonuclease/exonuclease/phosphatase family metal-dependent hydrolase